MIQRVASIAIFDKNSDTNYVGTYKIQSEENALELLKDAIFEAGIRQSIVSPKNFNSLENTIHYETYIDYLEDTHNIRIAINVEEFICLEGH